MSNCRNTTTNIGVYFRANADIRRQRWTANSKTFTAIDIRFVSPKGQDFIRQNGSLSPEIHTRPSSVNRTQDTALYPTNNSIWNTVHRPVFVKLQCEEHIIWKKENMVLSPQKPYGLLETGFTWSLDETAVFLFRRNADQIFLQWRVFTDSRGDFAGVGVSSYLRVPFSVWQEGRKEGTWF